GTQGGHQPGLHSCRRQGTTSVVSIVPAMSAGVGPWAYDLKVHDSLLLSMMHGMVGVVPCRSQSVTRNSHEALLQLNASAEQGRFYINNNVIASKKGY